MKKTLTLTMLCIVMAGGSYADAQRDNRHAESDVVTLIGNDKADKSEVEKTMKMNAPQSPNDNGLPRFALVGKENKFYLGIGAQFLGEAVFDWGDAMASPVLMTPSSITQPEAGNRGNLRFGWQTSSIYMNFVAMPGSKDKIGFFFKANFLGNNNSLSVHHLYAKYRGLTAGYTLSAFTDAAAEPFTIDYEGPNGYPFMSLFTAYWEQNFTKNFSGAIGVDAPTASLSTGGSTSTVNQRIPAIPLYLQYAWDDGSSHVRLSGIVRPMQYRNLVAGENKTIVGGGVQLSGMVNITDALSAQFNGAYGKGIGTYLQDDNGLGLDAVQSVDNGELKSVGSMGVTGGLSYKISPKVSANVTYSHLTNFFGDNARPDITDYKYGDYVAANVIYTVNRFVSAGIEYDYGHKKNVDGLGLHTNRVQCQLAVTF